MALSSNQIKELVNLIGLTRENEPNCQDCLNHVAEYAESELSGKPLTEALKCVEVHLSICVECREEYSALHAALSTLDDFGPAKHEE